MIIRKKIGPYEVGIWISLLALFFTVLGMAMQIYSLIDWEGAIKLGLQGESFYGGSVERALANVERGIAMADVVCVVPLIIISFIGVLRRKLFGFVSSMMVFAICIYFPLCFAFQRRHTDLNTVLAALCLFAFPSLIGIIMLWINRDTFLINTNHKESN